MTDNYTLNPIEKMSPKEWLTFMRQKYGLKGNFSMPKQSLEDFLSRLPSDTSKENARAVWEARYNKTAADVHDELMQDYLKQIIPVLRENEKATAGETFFGIMPTCDFNGYAGREYSNNCVT